jgi:hypothetical protein
MFDGNERFRVSLLNEIRGGQSFQNSLVSVLTRRICGSSWHGPQPGVKHEFVADERPGTLPKPPVLMFIKTRAFTESEHEKSVNKGRIPPCHYRPLSP